MKALRTILIILLMFAGMNSCKKAVDAKKQDLLLDAITTGSWRVDQYLEGTVNITQQFKGFSFKFDRNGGVVSSSVNGNQAGTWSGDIQNYTITSNFPGAADPLKKLNGTWKVTNTTSNTVEAEMSTATGKNILHLAQN